MSIFVRRFQVLCVCAVITSLVGCSSSTGSVKQDELIGDQIILALDKYKAEHGSYPDTLWSLEPDYLSQIARPKYGDGRWDCVHYCKDDSFGLAIWGRHTTDNGYVYSSQRRQWEVAENSF
jgi:hypothetical protein